MTALAHGLLGRLLLVGVNGLCKGYSDWKVNDFNRSRKRCLLAEREVVRKLLVFDTYSLNRKLHGMSCVDGSYFPVVDDNHTLAHRDAVGWEPSTAP